MGFPGKGRLCSFGMGGHDAGGLLLSHQCAYTVVACVAQGESELEKVKGMRIGKSEGLVSRSFENCMPLLGLSYKCSK